MLTDPGLLGQFAGQGVVGVIAALFIWLWQRSNAEVRGQYEKRIDDISAIRQVIDTTNLQYAAVAAATENRTRANESVAVAANEMAKQLAALRDVLERTSEQSERNGQCLQDLLYQMRELTAEVSRSHLAVTGEMQRSYAALGEKISELQREVRGGK